MKTIELLLTTDQVEAFTRDGYYLVPDFYDMALDLRRDSPTFRHWFGVELSAQIRQALYIPAGCAHGLQTLEDNSEVFYQMSAAFHAESACGARFDDPAFAIRWPLPVTVTVIAERDRTYRDFQP